MAQRVRKKLTVKQKKRWLSYIRTLKLHLPTRYPVSIRIVNQQCSGMYWRENKLLLITIAHNQPFDMKIDALCHEYAHALDFADEKPISQEHSESWGVYYAKCYQCYEYLYSNHWDDSYFTKSEIKQREQQNHESNCDGTTL